MPTPNDGHDKLPQAIRSEKAILFGREVTVHVLDNGMRLIDSEDFHNLLADMGVSDADTE